MRLAVMQPYFFPCLGYFDLMNRVDVWVVFDTAQYRRRSWMNRNRVLHPTAEWSYITVPISRHHRHTPINEVRISERAYWKDKILRQLLHYRRTAPGYSEVIAFLEGCFSSSEENLARANTLFLRRTCQQLGITTSIRVLSEMGLQLGPIDGPGDWALRISQALEASEYINRPGGAGLFHERAFADGGIRLTFQAFEPMAYACGRLRFVPNMSIIDVMMWNSCEQIAHYLDSCLPKEDHR